MVTAIMKWVVALRSLFRKPDVQPEDPYAYAAVRNRPRRPLRSGSVAVAVEPEP